MKLDDSILMTPTLLRRFIQEAELEGGNGQHFALLRRSNSELIAHNPYSPELDPSQMTWGADVLRLLNRELHHDGAWVLCFTHPAEPGPPETILHNPPKHWEYARYCLMWLDKDGDVQFTVEWVRHESELFDFADVMLAGIESTAQKAEAAWETWRTMMIEVLDPREGETFKRAQGQRAPSAMH